jgi:hypothetical protein
MLTLLFWLYLANAVALTIHEMDSVYWKEWNLFRLPGGVEGFLLIHIPLLALALYGLVLVHDSAWAGLIFSLVLGLAGVGGFGLHTYFIRTGHKEFTTPFSQFILWSMLLLSLAQVGVTALLLMV